MELYIQIKDGQPYEHPILGDNFREAFPEIDVNNLPQEFARFERVQKPEIDVFQVYEGVTYEWVDGVIKDVHHVRNMTEEETIAKQAEIDAEIAEMEKRAAEALAAFNALTGSAPNVIG